MVDVEKMSDAELRAELSVRGANVGPVTGTTRSLYEKKLKKLLAAGGKTPARPVAPSPAPATKAVSKPTPKPTSVPKSPARKADKTPDTSRRSLPRAAANTTVNSTFNRSEMEEMSDSDDDREEDDDEEILSPKSRQSSFRSNVTTSSIGRGRPVSSTPTKKLPPVHKPSPIPASSSKVSSTRTTVNTTTRIPTTPRNVHVPVPGLITDFTPSFATFGSDRPGATPPRKSIYTSNVSSVLHDLGNTTGEEDDDFEGEESSRIIYKSEEPSKGLVKNAWNKVLGYGFNASKNPGDSYDLRAGASRIRVQKNPKTGKVTVKQSNIFNESLVTALYVVIILFVVLSIAYVFTTYQPKTANFSGYWGVLKSAARDSVAFFYNYAVLPLVSVALCVFLVVGLYYGHRRYKEAKEIEDNKLYELIDRITALIKESSADGDPYVSQPHVRDVMFPPSKRRSVEMARWEEAVKFIDKNESRIATDVIVLPSGNECAVWKWIGNQSQRRW